MQAPNEATTRREEWNLWRGSPELLAQVARAALRATAHDMEAPPRCLIDIEVAGDHEVFTSPSDFTAQATREALRDFRRIRVQATGEALTVTVNWSWSRAWWATGRGKDAEVILEVAGPDEKSIEVALAAVRPSIERGGTKRARPQLAIGLALAWGLAALVVAAVVNGLYLLEARADVIAWGGAGVSVLGCVLGLVGGSWVYPSLEVAPAGQTRLWRTIKFVVPVVVTLIVSGIAKLLYE